MQNGTHYIFEQDCALGSTSPRRPVQIFLNENKEIVPATRILYDAPENTDVSTGKDGLSCRKTGFTTEAKGLTFAGEICPNPHNTYENIIQVSGPAVAAMNGFQVAKPNASGLAL